MPYEGTITDGKWNGNMKFIEEKLDHPARWTRPRRIFVNSMSDVFHENVEDSQIHKIFAAMSLAPQHTFQVLTKRPERMMEVLSQDNIEQAVLCERIWQRHHEKAPNVEGWPLSNVWLGVSVEDQKTADERIPLLLQTPAAQRFISAEPLLGHITHLPGTTQCQSCGGIAWNIDGADKWCSDCGEQFTSLDWVIVGGESGPGSRPMSPEWAQTLRDQCEDAEIPFLFKQWGEFDEQGEKVGKKKSGRELDGEFYDGYPD